MPKAHTPRIAYHGLLHDGLGYWARIKPDATAIDLDGETISYGALARWSDGIAAHLQRQGIAAGNNVAIAAANDLAWAAAAFGILKTGATIVPFNDRFLGDELAYLASHSQSKLIVADAERSARLEAAGVSTPRISMEELDAFRQGAAEDWQAERVSSDSVAMIIFTSGSTARPKGAMMTHGSYLLKFMEMRTLDPLLGPETHALMPFGMHSSPGLPWGIIFTTILGGSLFATRKYVAERVLATLERERISFFIGVPMIYDQISRLPQFASADLSSLSFARIGGASASADILQRWLGRGVVVRQLYGMTEVGGGSIVASTEEALANPMSCGRGLAFSRFRIVRDDGSECDADEPGHVLLQGPGMMAGYWNDEEASRAALVDGWMHTGDIGIRDKDGYFTFVDRAKEMIKSGGFNVSPTEIEAVICALDGVVEAAVFAVPDSKFTEAPCACIYADRAITPDDVYAHCASRLAGFKLPRYVLAFDAPLPRLANQKIDRRALKAVCADPSALPPRIEAAST